MPPKAPHVPDVPFVVPPSWAPRLSPNCAPRVRPVTAIVLHADASEKVESTLDWVRRPESKVSYHVLISRTGATFLIVHPDKKAYHAGVSELDGEPFCNAYSVGVSLSNKNDGKEPYPTLQVNAAVAVCVQLCRHYGIPVERIATHAAVATPPGRKTDPLGLDVIGFRTRVASGLLASAA